jgi:hypothetical protein
MPPPVPAFLNDPQVVGWLPALQAIFSLHPAFSSWGAVASPRILDYIEDYKQREMVDHIFRHNVNLGLEMDAFAVANVAQF